ncbi:hypothetical protein P8807_18900 [Bacillus subtilis]|uniref:hypothetical protein n=1 Tax=Bacillus subtilis TaxID=1423 RepID=UPI002DB89880|nr:hypothetical protein [Bacillus subtilis]MEC0413595.1 hypothetical protein [Bacillus subtilis]MEC0423255.1 hypothetical protein [Bacillus subtilis]
MNMCEITDWGSAFYAFVETTQKHNLPFPEDAADWSTAKLIAEIERINKGEMGLLKKFRRLRRSNRKERKA